ncbi:MAG TPA: nucleoside triphosphate pyrophosphohydrolase [Polyangiaceae bacterium]|nr:nucleoside triphosphate pyrophosphohydrolase [Polyangiaceae bacterium]
MPETNGEPRAGSTAVSGAGATGGASAGTNAAAGAGRELDGVRAFDEREPRPVPPMREQDGATIARLVGVMRRLLGPGGCPWDREQSFETLRKYALEEACEVIDAIDSGDRAALREELGDLLLQVVFQSELARREGSFAIDDVVAGIVDKLVKRHPHVFGDVDARDADEVLRNWEKLKAQEKGERGLLSGVPRSMPALTRAQRIGEKVARVGFDWEDASGSRAKVAEEMAELDAAIARSDPAAAEEELGDVLFALVNLARHLRIDAEGALRRTIDKFTARFAHVERRVREEHGGWGDPASGDRHLPLAVLDGYWEEAKRAG